MADFCWKAFCPMHQRMNEDLKRDIRDEVEFRQAQLNAQGRVQVTHPAPAASKGGAGGR